MIIPLKACFLFLLAVCSLFPTDAQNVALIEEIGPFKGYTNIRYSRFSVDMKGNRAVLAHGSSGNVSLQHYYNKHWYNRSAGTPLGLNTRNFVMDGDILYATRMNDKNELELMKWEGDKAWKTVDIKPLNGEIASLMLGPMKELIVKGIFKNDKGSFFLAKLHEDKWLPMDNGAFDPDLDETREILKKNSTTDPVMDAKGNMYFITKAENPYVLKWDGSNWTTLGKQFDHALFSLAVSADGTVYVSGSKKATGHAIILKWWANQWNPLTCETGSVPCGNLQALAISKDNELIAAGSNRNGNEYPVLSWTGNTWEQYALLPTGPLESLIVSGDHIYSVINAGTPAILRFKPGTIQKIEKKPDPVFVDIKGKEVWDFYNEYMSALDGPLRDFNTNLKALTNAEEEYVKKRVSEKTKKATVEVRKVVLEYRLKLETFNLQKGQNLLADVLNNNFYFVKQLMEVSHSYITAVMDDSPSYKTKGDDLQAAMASYDKHVENYEAVVAYYKKKNKIPD